MQKTATIWIDNDACPNAVRDVIFKAARRLSLAVKIVANQYMHPPRGVLAKMICVGEGFDAADNYIAEEVQQGDLVITSDIPLADRVVEAGALAISSKGEIYDESNIKDKLSVRNLAREIRTTGELQGGPAPFSAGDLKQFAASFDKVVNKLK